MSGKEKGMRRFFWACVLVFFPLGLSGETFFVYNCEMVNGELAESPFMVKEGVLDGLFETGHIIFDDGVNNCEISLENISQMNRLYKVAMDGGARYLIAIFAKSNKEILPNKRERVSSTVKYYLFDAKTMECIGQGEDFSSNQDKEAEIKGNDVLFSLGQTVAGKVDSLFAAYLGREGDRKNREK
jgi:hypothetical protein